MAKRVLIISPMPSHPPNAGSNIRILRLASTLKSMGHEVHFLFIKLSADGDVQQMQAFWKKLFYCVPARYPRRNLPRRLVERLKHRFNLHLYWLDNWHYAIDDWYDDSLDRFIAKLAGKIAFDVVLVEYVFFSRALRHFDRTVLKIIDTHDVFTHRHREFQKIKENGAYKWFTATPREEALGLNRADVIIAIQKQEADFFKRLTDKRVVTVGHLIALPPPSAHACNNHELLFVGAVTRDNQLGIEFFIKDILPRIQIKHPHVKLLLAGNICDAVDNSPACVKLGAVDDLGEIYQRAAIVINPNYTGTGLAIKSIEALSYAKPLITTIQGSRGLEDGGGDAFCVAQSAQDFADKIMQLLENEKSRKTFAEKAYHFACNYHRVNFNTLSAIIQNEHKTKEKYYKAV